MSRRHGISILAALVLLAAVLPTGAGAHHKEGPGLQPGLVDALCPRVVPPDENCYTIAFPGEVWAAAAILPIAEGADSAYDSLIPEPFFPIEDRREVAVLMFRLDIDFQLDRDIDTNPGPGYAEGSVAIRVGFPAEDGYPYDEGWWTISQPLNDASQYGGGRGIGLPKYMADAGLEIDEDGTWFAHATDWGATYEDSSSVIPGGNQLTIEWTDADPAVGVDRAHELWSWGQYGEPLFVQDPPYDEPGDDKDAALVKFTPASLVPVFGFPNTPFTAAPDPRIGTAAVTLEGDIPASDVSFTELIGEGPHTVGGTSAFTRGYAFMTVDNLENNRADQ